MSVASVWRSVASRYARIASIVFGASGRTTRVRCWLGLRTGRAGLLSRGRHSTARSRIDCRMGRTLRVAGAPTPPAGVAGGAGGVAGEVAPFDGALEDRLQDGEALAGRGVADAAGGHVGAHVADHLGADRL